MNVAVPDETNELKTAQASTEDWCERFPDEGHSWSYTSHAGRPRITTRHCTSCKYLSVQPVREDLAAGKFGIAVAEERYQKLANVVSRIVGDAEHSLNPVGLRYANLTQVVALLRHALAAPGGNEGGHAHSDEDRARCTSCDHEVRFHQPDGCWYTVEIGKGNLVCVCTVPLSAGARWNPVTRQYVFNSGPSEPLPADQGVVQGTGSEHDLSSAADWRTVLLEVVDAGEWAVLVTDQHVVRLGFDHLRAAGDEHLQALRTKLEHADKERNEAKAWAVKLRGLLWNALMGEIPISVAVDVTGTLVERAKALHADLAEARREAERLRADIAKIASKIAEWGESSPDPALVSEIGRDLRALASTGGSERPNVGLNITADIPALERVEVDLDKWLGGSDTTGGGS